MALERQDIEKRDFPTGRRGYDPGAVDAHLRAIADQVEQLKRTREPSEATLAGAASDRVKAIVEAAEATAADLRRAAEEDAASARAKAVEEAREQVASVREATRSLLERLQETAARLDAQLAEVEQGVGELRTTATGSGRAQPESEPATEQEPEAAVEKEPEAATEEEREAEPEPEPEPEREPDDSEGARLIALNMALNGTPREETDRYLADNFELEDRKTLLDEVYARVG